MRARSFGTLLVLGTLVVAACADDATLPTSTPALKKADLPSGAAPEAQINRLLHALLPQPAKRHANKLFAKVKGAMASGRTEEAREHMFALLDLTLTTDLLDPSDLTQAEAVSRLIDLLFAFVDLEPPAIDPALLENDDQVVAVVPPEGDTVVTSTGFAGVGIPDDALDESIVVTIQRLDQDPCLPIDLPQFQGCYEFERYPAGDFAAEVVVGVCTDVSSLDFPQDTLVLLHKYDPNAPEQGVKALARREAGFIDCTDFVPLGSSSLLGMVTAGWRAFHTAVATWIGPTPLHAAAVGEVPKRIGGGTGGFTDIGGALPAQMEIYEGDNQQALVGTAVAVDPAVLVTDYDGDPVAGAVVSFAVTAGDGDVFPTRVETDANGIARVDYWRLGPDPGTNTLEASGVGIADPEHGGPFIPLPPANERTLGTGTLEFTATGIAGVLYGVNSGDDGLSTIDAATGQVTFIGPLDPDPDSLTTPVAMAIRPTDQAIFVWNNSDGHSASTLTGVLLTVDPCNGLAARVDPTTSPQGTLQALAFAPDGALYGLDSDLFAVNSASGQKTLIGSLGLRVGGADFDASGTLYGVELTSNATQRLVTIDTNTGLATVVATLDTDIGRVGSVVFGPGGTLIGSGFGGPSGSILFDIDPSNGWVTNIRALAGGSTPQGMGFAPACATPPSIGTWTPTGSMSGPRRDHTATLLNDGAVLIVGGTGTQIAELYHPASGTFTSVGNTRFGHGQGATATKLLDGRVLIVGGASAETFDPSSNTFTATTGNPTTSRQYHSATLLNGGRVLIAAGQHQATGGPQTHDLAEVYDPVTDSFTPTGSLNTDRSGHAATVLPDGRVLVIGGTQTTTPGSGICLSSAEIYDPTTGTFTSTVASMADARCGPEAVSLSGIGPILILGWSTANAELYDPATGTFGAAGSMATAHSSGTATLLADGRVLVAGGVVSPQITLRSAEVYDPTNGLFAPATVMNVARQQHTATLLQDGRVLIVGGFDFGINADRSSAELFSIP